MPAYHSHSFRHALNRAPALAGVLVLAAACSAPTTSVPSQLRGPDSYHATPLSSASAGSTRPTESTEPAPATAISSASYSPSACSPEPADIPAGVIPEGAAIGWTDCGGLWAVGADGRPVLVSDRSGASAPPYLSQFSPSAPPSWPSAPRFSPDRRRVAFQVRSEGPDREPAPVYVAALDGAEPRLVIDVETLTRQLPKSEHMPEGSWTEVWFYDWLPDGSGLAFTTEEEFRSDDSDNGVPDWNYAYRDDLWSVPLEGGEPRQLLPPRQGGHFAFSPDGQHVVITRLEDQPPPLHATIAVARADGSDVRVLFEHPPMASESDWRPYQLPRWAPDSRSLLVVSPAPSKYPGDDLAYFDGPARLLRLNLDGGTATIAEAGPGSLPWTNDYNAWWSPDGRRVAFLQPAQVPPTPSRAAYPASAPASAPSAAPDLVLAGLDSTRSVFSAAAPPELNNFAWSPDGERFSFPFWDRTPEGGIRPGGTRLGSPALAPREPAGSADWRETAWLTGDRLVVATGDGLAIYRIDENLEAVDPVPIMTGAQPANLVVAPPPADTPPSSSAPSPPR